MDQPSPAGSADRSSSPPETADAWQMMSLVLDWTKHADAKAGATLAGAAALGGLLYSLVDQVHRPGAAFVTVATVCAATVVGTALAASAALRPRRRAGGPRRRVGGPRRPAGRPRRRAGRPVVSSLFYLGIAERFPDADGYTREFEALNRDRRKLVAELSGLIWNGAVIVGTKHRLVGLASTGLVVSVVTLAAAAVLSRLP